MQKEPTFLFPRPAFFSSFLFLKNGLLRRTAATNVHRKWEVVDGPERYANLVFLMGVPPSSPFTLVFSPSSLLEGREKNPPPRFPK